ncbi:hypothetical protein [Clostridium aceticum]|uniref:hypothetical protein n=1 Tax=Clostridium aceticum TaxID=84022 RepID=UPI0005E4F646|nr:hypothetical protein [Clostridium aceticum]KJF25514.1 hypothetical protein TZ02_18075 [Clostridium aceticum]
MRFNVLFDIALFTKLTNKYIHLGDYKRAKTWFETAYFDCSINAKMQSILLEHLDEIKKFDIRLLFNCKKQDERNDTTLETPLENDND